MLLLVYSMSMDDSDYRVSIRSVIFTTAHLSIYRVQQLFRRTSTRLSLASGSFVSCFESFEI